MNINLNHVNMQVMQMRLSGVVVSTLDYESAGTSLIPNEDAATACAPTIPYVMT